MIKQFQLAAVGDDNGEVLFENRTFGAPTKYDAYLDALLAACECGGFEEEGGIDKPTASDLRELYPCPDKKKNSVGNVLTSMDYNITILPAKQLKKYMKENF